MIVRELTEKQLKREQALDLIKEIAYWLVGTILFFAYWMSMLLFASLVLISIWNPRLENIVQYSIILTIISSIIFGIRLIKKKKKQV